MTVTFLAISIIRLIKREKMFHDRTFQETNKIFNKQEVNFENVTGMFRDGRSLVDLTISSKRTKFDYLFCPLLDLLRHPSLFNWVVQPMKNAQLVNGITVKFYHGQGWAIFFTENYFNFFSSKKK